MKILLSPTHEEEWEIPPKKAAGMPFCCATCKAVIVPDLKDIDTDKITGSSVCFCICPHCQHWVSLSNYSNRTAMQKLDKIVVGPNQSQAGVPPEQQQP